MTLAQSIRSDKYYPVYDQSRTLSSYSVVPRVMLIEQALVLMAYEALY